MQLGYCLLDCTVHMELMVHFAICAAALLPYVTSLLGGRCYRPDSQPTRPVIVHLRPSCNHLGVAVPYWPALGAQSGVDVSALTTCVSPPSPAPPHPSTRRIVIAWFLPPTPGSLPAISLWCVWLWPAFRLRCLTATMASTIPGMQRLGCLPPALAIRHIAMLCTR